MKKTVLFFSMFIVIGLQAQFIEINDVGHKRFSGVSPILNGEDQEVTGYYLYYMLDKEKGNQKGMRTFEFSMIDKELTNINKTQINFHLRSVVKSTVFNGKYMLLTYDDKKNKQVKLNIIDNTGKIITDKALPAEKRYLMDSKVYADATGEGFYIVSPVKNKNVKGFTITKVDNKLEQIWKIEEVPDRGTKEIQDLVNNKDRFVIWENNSPSGKMIKPFITCYDAKTGSKYFSKDAYDGTSTLLYNQLRIDDDGSVYAGGAYIDGERTKDVNVSGIYVLKLDADGKEIINSKVSNAEKIQAALKGISDGFAVGSKEKVFVEDLIIEGDYILVISEMFRKNLNVTPWRIQWTRDMLTGKYIGSPHPEDKKTTKFVMEIMDYIIFKFDKNGELVEIKPIAKEKKNKITAWEPYCWEGGMELAKILSDAGWFDYSFIEQNENGELVMVCKDNAEAEKAGKSLEGRILDKGPQVFTYSLKDDYAQKTVNLKQQGKVDLEQGKVGYFNVLRNSDGKIVLVYFQKKLKKVSISIESLD